MNDHREQMPSGKDKKIFRQTAQKTKKINVKPHIARGGIRL